MQAIDKIHHISAIVGNPQETLAFYRDILGLRLIKQTVNFDDVGTYHLYFSNHAVGNGPVITFFNWKNAYPGRVGSGQVGRIAFRIPKGSLKDWQDRLTEHEVVYEMTNLFQRPTLELSDTHELALALVEGDQEAKSLAILGFPGTILLSAAPELTARTLTKDLGLKKRAETSEVLYLETVGMVKHQLLIPKQSLPVGRWGVGTVHHIAWSIPTFEAHRAWQDDLYQKGYGVTEMKDRYYFQAIYFQEPGKIIFELATEKPGFTRDEAEEALGERLMLPPEFESRRQEIIAKLPNFTV